MKKLIFGLKNSGGRNNFGKITAFHRGGGVKNSYRIIDFCRFLTNKPAKVVEKLYDPNRTAYLFLICYSNGILSFILGIHKIKIGDFLYNNVKKNAFIGNCLRIKDMLRGACIHNLELRPNKGFKLIRSAGTSGVLLSRYRKKYCVVKLPSGELRAFLLNNRAVLGIVSNIYHKFKKYKKAGSSRFLNVRPSVRGVAKNPVDHPHGGQTSGGIHPMSPWARLTKSGVKTRKKLASNNKLILNRSKRKKKNK